MSESLTPAPSSGKESSPGGQTAPNGEPLEIQPPKGALGIIFLIVFMDLLGFGVIVPLLPFYAERCQATPPEVTFLFSIYSICQLIAAPFLGLLSDKYGRRPVLILSQLGSVVGYVMLGIVTDIHIADPRLVLWLIYLSRIIDGFSGGNISTAQAYIADVTTEKTRSRGMGIIGAAFGIGFVIGPMLGGLLGGAHHEHASWPAYAAGVFSFIATILTYLKLPEPKRHVESDAQFFLHPSKLAPMLKNRRLVNLLLIAFVTMGAFVMMESTLAMFLERTFGYGPRSVGFFYAYVGVIICVVQGGLISRITKLFGEWNMAIAGPILVAIGLSLYGLLAWNSLFYLLLLAGAGNALGRSIQQPSMSTLVSNSAPRDQQGATFGMFHSMMSLGRIVGPIIAGYSYKSHISAPFFIAASLSIIASIWTMALSVSAD